MGRDGVFQLQQTMETIKRELCIIGSGIAGSMAALNLAKKYSVTLINQGDASDNATSWAQGGIAISFNENDIKSHITDTLHVGRAHNSPNQVKKMIQKSAEVFTFLNDIGVHFDKDEKGFKKALEAGHSQARVYHHKDKTGSEIKEKLAQAIKKNPNIEELNFHKLSAIYQEDHQCQGFVVVKDQKHIYIDCQALILATGGYSSLFQNFSTPEHAQGSAIAAAYLAGAELSNMEFIQFHPTCFLSEKQQFLISETLRGAGAKLLNHQHNYFLKKYHPKEELSPRDILSRAIFMESKKGQIYLNAQKVKHLQTNFPTIYQKAMNAGYNLNNESIPISPAAHFTIGGIKIDQDYQSNIKGLYAIGECANNSSHGANRLASNSLLEAAIAGYNLEIKKSKKQSNPIKIKQTTSQEVDNSIRESLWLNCGIMRNEQELKHALQFLKEKLSKQSENPQFILSYLIIQAALHREESCGVHFRKDFPKESQQKKLSVQYFKNGQHHHHFEELKFIGDE